MNEMRGDYVLFFSSRCLLQMADNKQNIRTAAMIFFKAIPPYCYL